ncbi:cytochrome c biogenesis protein DipZ [Brevundimonas sp. Root1279]|uniref:cytochrome c biogenesis protein DipZ n=1 Tax=Brevundimonas sp. Root1279 TaxID=1736443 RepID=UPI0006F63A13|nr:cytochrome c biogenesis protein DipZ [Brevundimonas sp. Root1279]KQW78802.1 cytochrome C biogenesis protein [Brevundimonas sp. Root1279]
MLLLFVAYLAGALTIVSPCILPVLPFVFARAGQPFVRSGLPLLAGMAITFAAVATLAAVGGGWAVQANLIGRWAALALLAVLGLTLLFPTLADRLTRPLVAMGARLTEGASEQTRRTGASVGPSFVLGIATGLLWAPCAGPVLGLILTGAALQGASASTTLLLVAYALGAATSLALALLVGGRVFKAMKASLGVGEWVRRGLGALVLVGVAAIALGLDTGLLTRLSAGGTNRIEQGLLARAGAGAPEARRVDVMNLPDFGPMPGFEGGGPWLNASPLTPQDLQGKVVVVDFWTYSCINCVRTFPYVRAWAERYKDAGLVVIGVHTPEFAFEKDPANVRDAVRRFDLTYPVVMDNDFAIWRAYSNRYWPAHYFIDARGHVRHLHFGEGDYDQSEQIIRQLLREAGRDPGPALSRAAGEGAEAASSRADDSPETYVGYARARSFASPEPVLRDAARLYSAPALTLNQWALSGSWIVRAEQAEAVQAGGRLRFRFKARDLHLVLGSAGDRPVRFRVTLDGRPPGPDAGADIDAQGFGRIDGQRLYQLIRRSEGAGEHLFEIEFLDPGAQAFAFTFG